MKLYEKIRSMRLSKGWSQEDMADKLYMSVNGYANIEQGKTDVQVSRLEKIAEAFGIELLELFSFGERNVFYLLGAAYYNKNNNFNHCENHVQLTDSSNEKNECEHELEIARLLLQQKEKEIVHLNKIISLLEK